MKAFLGLVVLTIGLAVPTSARAYTLVLRSGERVDIGNAYRLNGSRVEYISGDRVLRLDLIFVDLQATAVANGETVGAFVGRASAPAAPLAPQASARARRRNR